MAHFRSFGVSSVEVSIDGKTWHDITGAIVGPLWVSVEDSDELTEITPDNPLYAELVEILNKA